MARGDIVVRLIGDTSDLERKFASVGSRLQRTGARLSSVGRSLTTGLTLPILAVGAGAVKSAIDFETAFSGIRKTVSATEAQFQKLSEGIRKMAKETGTSANDLAAIGEAAGALGIATEDILEFIGVVNRLEVATDLTAESASTALGKLKNILNLNVGELENLSSAVVDLGNTGSSTEPEIVDLALRIAGAGRNAGLTAAEILGLSAAIADAGINAERGGTSIQKTLQDMAVAVSEGGKDLAAFGKVTKQSGAEFAESFGKDPADAVASFIDGLQRIRKEAGPGGVLTVLKNLGITESRQIDTLQLLSQAQSGVAGKIRQASDAWRDGTAAQEEFDKKQATTERRIAVLREKFRDIAVTLGEALIPVLEEATPVIETLANVFQTAVDVFKSLPGPVKKGVVAFAALLAALGPVLFVAGTMFRVFGDLSRGLGVLRDALRRGAGALTGVERAGGRVGTTMTDTAVVTTKASGKMTKAFRGVGAAAGLASAAVAGAEIGTAIEQKWVRPAIKEITRLNDHVATQTESMKNRFVTQMGKMGDVGSKQLFPVTRALNQLDAAGDLSAESMSRIYDQLQLLGKAAKHGLDTGQAIRDIAKGGSQAQQAVQRLTDQIRQLESGIQVPIRFVASGGGPVDLALANAIPQFHSGGVFHAPTAGGEGLALLKDGERVLPPHASGGTVVKNYHLNIAATPGHEAEAGRAIVKAIKAYERGNGTRWRDS